MSDQTTEAQKNAQLQLARRAREWEANANDAESARIESMEADAVLEAANARLAKAGAAYREAIEAFNALHKQTHTLAEDGAAIHAALLSCCAVCGAPGCSAQLHPEEDQEAARARAVANFDAEMTYPAPLAVVPPPEVKS